MRKKTDLVFGGMRSEYDLIREINPQIALKGGHHAGNRHQGTHRAHPTASAGSDHAELGEPGTMAGSHVVQGAIEQRLAD